MHTANVDKNCKRKLHLTSATTINEWSQCKPANQPASQPKMQTKCHRTVSDVWTQDRKIKWSDMRMVSVFVAFSEYGRNYENEIHLKTWPLHHYSNKNATNAIKCHLYNSFTRLLYQYMLYIWNCPSFWPPIRLETDSFPFYNNENGIVWYMNHCSAYIRNTIHYYVWIKVYS